MFPAKTVTLQNIDMMALANTITLPDINSAVLRDDYENAKETEGK
jgi:hypothetical protein